MIEGNADKGNANVRLTPTDATASNIVGKLYLGDKFTASEETSQDSRGRGVWLRLLSKNDVVISTPMWIAGWVVFSKIVPDPIPQEPLGVPTEIQLVEKFENGATRTSVWVNPTVVE